MVLYVEALKIRHANAWLGVGTRKSGRLSSS